MKSILLLALLCLASFRPEVFAWGSSNHRIRSAPLRRTKTLSNHHRASRTSFSSCTQIKLKFIDSSDEESAPRLILSPEEDDAIRSVAKSLSSDDTYGVGWFDRPEAWATAKQDFPVLQPYEDADLRDAYLKQKPKILVVFTDTPLGPFLFINLIVKFSGFTWCDTPFGQASACLSK
ncbi:unnamed protein product [Cylindrotheca closterium]|uniref:Uncharacterized protein n=1 Tax=Cylindrotheca closterium TaxID=2856 RepID=A0AAD2CW81_9STRA|nr:unnamed protein product [Cylindrotheca closterium]